MLKQQIIYEIKRAENIYRLSLPENCNLGELYDVLYEIRTDVVNRINESLKQDSPKEPEQQKQE
jgi:hypothetical protein